MDVQCVGLLFSQYRRRGVPFMRVCSSARLHLGAPANEARRDEVAVTAGALDDTSLRRTEQCPTV